MARRAMASATELVVLAGPAHLAPDLRDVFRYIEPYWRSQSGDPLVLSPAVTGRDWSTSQLCGLYVNDSEPATRHLAALAMETLFDFGPRSFVVVRFVHVHARYRDRLYDVRLRAFARRNTPWPHLQRRDDTVDRLERVARVRQALNQIGRSIARRVTPAVRRSSDRPTPHPL